MWNVSPEKNRVSFQSDKKDYLEEIFIDLRWKYLEVNNNKNRVGF
jgi:hypothetical protein